VPERPEKKVVHYRKKERKLNIRYYRYMWGYILKKNAIYSMNLQKNPIFAEKKPF
jgi:hypothetical protein